MFRRQILNMKKRRYMQQKIWEFLMQRRQQSNEVPSKKLIDLVKRLEEALFKSARTTDEYLNLATLENRLRVLIKRLRMSNHNQQFSHSNSSPSIGTMIPTPGLQQSGNLNITGTQSVDSSFVNNSSHAIGPNGVVSRNFMATGNGSSSHVNGGTFSSDGALSGGYLQLQQQSYQFQRQQLVQNQVQQRVTQNPLPLTDGNIGQSHLTNMVSEVISGHGTENHDEGMLSQISDPSHFSGMHIQAQQNSVDDRSRAQLLSHPYGPQDATSSLTQLSDQMRHLLHPQQFTDPQSDFGSGLGGIQPDAALQDQWYSKSQDMSLVSGILRQDQKGLDEFRHRSLGQDVAQLNNLSSEESIIGQSDASRSAEPLSESKGTYRSNNGTLERQYKIQQRWLLFLRHARRCPAPEGKCQEPNCLTVQKLLKHMEHCNAFECPYQRCYATIVLISHHRRCRDTSCPLCILVKSYVQQAQLNALARSVSLSCQ